MRVKTIFQEATVPSDPTTVSNRRGNSPRRPPSSHRNDDRPRVNAPAPHRPDLAVAAPPDHASPDVPLALPAFCPLVDAKSWE